MGLKMGSDKRHGTNGCAAVMIRNSDAFDIEFVPMESLIDSTKQLDRDFSDDKYVRYTYGTRAAPDCVGHLKRLELSR